MIGGWKWSKWKFCHCRVSKDLNYTGNKNQQLGFNHLLDVSLTEQKGRAPSLPVRLFTSAPLVRTTAVSSASSSENKRGVKMPKARSCGSQNYYQTTVSAVLQIWIHIYIIFFLHCCQHQLASKHKAWLHTRTGANKRRTQRHKGSKHQRSCDPII